MKIPPTPPPIYLTAIDYYLDVYVTLAIIEERIEGKLPALEGIRITKVRKEVALTTGGRLRSSHFTD